ERPAGWALVSIGEADTLEPSAGMMTRPEPSDVDVGLVLVADERHPLPARVEAEAGGYQLRDRAEERCAVIARPACKDPRSVAMRSPGRERVHQRVASRTKRHLADFLEKARLREEQHDAFRRDIDGIDLHPPPQALVDRNPPELDALTDRIPGD